MNLEPIVKKQKNQDFVTAIDNLGDERDDLSESISTPHDKSGDTADIIQVPTEEDNEVTEIRQGGKGIMMTNF
jgi:hypothetical protein